MSHVCHIVLLKCVVLALKVFFSANSLKSVKSQHEKLHVLNVTDHWASIVFLEECHILFSLSVSSLFRFDASDCELHGEEKIVMTAFLRVSFLAGQKLIKNKKQSGFLKKTPETEKYDYFDHIDWVSSFLKLKPKHFCKWLDSV